MKHVQLFEDWSDSQHLNEIGEGVVPFAWRKTGLGKVDSWMAEMSTYDTSSSIRWYEFEQPLTFEFKSDKATYTVKIVGEFKYNSYPVFGRKPDAPKQHKFDVVIGVAFDVVNSKIETGKEELTNFGEQFKVVSTVTAIVEDVMKQLQEIQWIKVQEIHIAPKLEDADEGKPIAQTKRGRLYLEYIKKQGQKLKGDWTAEITNDMFVIKRGKWRGGDKFIQL